jgi:hypothetical protein
MRAAPVERGEYFEYFLSWATKSPLLTCLFWPFFSGPRGGRIHSQGAFIRVATLAICAAAVAM